MAIWRTKEDFSRQCEYRVVEVGDLDHGRRQKYGGCRGRAVSSDNDSARPVHRSVKRKLRTDPEVQALIDAIPGLVTVVNPVGKIIAISEMMARLLGLKKNGALGRSVMSLLAKLLPPQSRAIMRKMFAQDAAKMRSAPFEINAFDRRERKIIFEVNTSEIRFSGKPEFLTVFRDITERKRREETLRESEMRYRSLFESSRDAITINRPDGQFIDVNQSWLDLLGYSREEVARLKAQDVYANPSDRNKFRQEVGFKGFVRDYEIRVRRKDGTELDCLLTSVPWRSSDGKIIGYQGILRDITARKKIEEELRDSEKRFRKIFESAPIPTMITSLEGPILDVNNAWVQMSGYSREEAIGKSTIDLSMLLDPEERDKIVKTLLEKKRLSNIEISRRTKSGELRSLLNTLELVDLSGQSCILNMQVDITDRKRAEEKLRQHSEQLEEMVKERTRKLKSSEEKYRRIYETSVNAIYTTSVDGTILDINPAGVSMFGFDTLDELRKMNVIELYGDPSDRKELIELVRHGPVKGHEIQLKRKDGRVFDAFLNARALRDDEGKITGLQGAIMDITERRELERMRDQLTSTILLDVTRRRELEKIRDQFISVVTHELRTPLTSIKGYVDDVLTGEVGQMSEQVASSLLVVKRNADRLLDLVNELLEIRRLESGRFQLNLTLFDFREIVNHCAQEMKPLIDEKGQIFRMETPERPVTIRGDRTRLIQVLMNLLNNANKFTPENGNIVFRVEERGESIRIQVSDTGIGVRKEDLERIFEPFAAIEKPTYVKGTGLGLSVTKGLVEAHRGKIWAESLGEGKGTTFIVVLPKEEAVKSD
jgi:PAS domain S-box-containing protein